jgi:Tfp pilus assembly protein PilO
VQIQSFNFNFFKYIDKKTLRNSGILIGLIIVFIMICLVPAVKSNRELKAQCVDLENNIIRSIKKIEDYPQLKKQMEDVERYVTRHLGRLLDEGHKTRLIGDVSDMAKKCDVAIVSMKPRPYAYELPEDFLKYVKPFSYELLLESGYHQFGTFINEIENFEVTLKVEEFHIETTLEDDESHAIKLILTTYAKI